jgi:hypothetical protein
MNDLVHIGLPKSASTWLQLTAFPVLEPASFHGPYTPLGLSLTSLLYEHEYQQGSLEAAARDQRSRSGRRLVLSLEGLSFRGQVLPDRPRATIRETAQRLGNELNKPDVLLIVRRQDRLMRSVYAQYIHQGGVLDFDDWHRRPSRAYAFEAEQYDHMRTISDYAPHASSVTVIPFELLTSSPAIFLAQIAQALGHEGTPTDISMGRPINTSLSVGGLRTLQWWNRHLRRSPANPRPLVALPFPEKHRKAVQVVADPIARRLPAKVKEKQDEQIASFAARFAASNRELQARIDVDLAELGYPL